MKGERAEGCRDDGEPLCKLRERDTKRCVVCDVSTTRRQNRLTAHFLAREGPYKTRLTLDMTRNFPETWPPVTERVAPLQSHRWVVGMPTLGRGEAPQALRGEERGHMRGSAKPGVGGALAQGAGLGGDSSGGGGGEAAQGPTRMTPEQAGGRGEGGRRGAGSAPLPRGFTKRARQPRAAKPPPRGLQRPQVARAGPCRRCGGGVRGALGAPPASADSGTLGLVAPPRTPEREVTWLPYTDLLTAARCTESARGRTGCLLPEYCGCFLHLPTNCPPTHTHSRRRGPEGLEG